MESSEEKSKTPRKTEDNKGNIQEEQQEQINKNLSNNMHQTNLMNDESILDPSKSFIELDPDISKKLSQKICKIVIETQKGRQIGTGFILAFPIDLEWFYCLITNDHVINNESINNNDVVNISYEKEVNIKLDKNKRYIKSFIDKKLDITVIEILDEDNISKKYYLYPELNTPINNELIKKEIYIPQYFEGLKLKKSEGIIKDIIKNEFAHLVNTIKGSSGAPIIQENSYRVIGIYKGGIENIENYGIFIYPVINSIKDDIRKRRNNGKYINDKYIYGDGKYYIGEFKNNIPNGKGIKYYKNGNILYEGDWVDGKPEGNGKFNREDGNYYIGQFKKGLRNGKGTQFYPNGNIKYEGDYVNDEYEGNGKYIWEDCEYFIGQWKNGLRNGKGIIYYPNGKIKYEGDFVNDKREGYGKYIYENGEYYIGQWKNGKIHGKGILYYLNGNIRYEGDWVNYKGEGYGKYIYKDSEYYIGQFKNGKRHGKGIEYYSNGNIKFEGDWINNKIEGYGKYIYKNGDYYIGQLKNNLNHGKGTMYYSNGEIKQKGYWINDEFFEN